jgi:membrane associated rhomboid family serine protease
MPTTQLKNIPVSIAIGILIIIIYSLYLTQAIISLPCGKDLISIFYSNFVHLKISHLAVNLFALYALSEVEKDIGPRVFFSLITFLLFFNTIVYFFLRKLIPSIPCSIGFSGILFGISAWELVTTKEFNILLILSVLAMVMVPTIEDPKASLIGHSVGALSGVVGGLLWNRIGPTLGFSNRRKKSNN